MTNAHGLSRLIPEPVKREVRQRCGFGCVVCGNAFIEYDHLDPPFAEATEHVASGIVLLCGGCHARKTSGALSEDTVRRHAASPAARQAGFSFGPLDIGPVAPIVRLGNFQGVDFQVLIAVGGEPIVSMFGPEVPGGPYRLCAMLRDEAGRLVLGLVNNEWVIPPENWDVTIIGQRITVRGGERDIVLQVRSDPPRLLVMERLDMVHRGYRISATEGQATEITTPTGAHLRSHGGNIVAGFSICMDVRPDSVWLGAHFPLAPT